MLCEPLPQILRGQGDAKETWLAGTGKSLVELYTSLGRRRVQGVVVGGERKVPLVDL